MESRTRADGGRGADGWGAGRRGRSGLRAGGLEVGVGLLEGLVGGVDLGFERVELRIAEELPPVALELSVAGLRGLPAVYLFEGVGTALFELRRELGRAGVV